jgi:5-methylcytosine-specific restriction endonuclease McrA
MRDYVPMPNRVAFTRFNVFCRDRFKCQYCGNKFDASDLTFEHVVPRSAGGQTRWDNIVAACDRCNSLKGSRTDMKPLHWPREPTAHELMNVKRSFPPNHLHKSWVDYLYWDMEIDP